MLSAFKATKLKTRSSNRSGGQPRPLRDVTEVCVQVFVTSVSSPWVEIDAKPYAEFWSASNDETLKNLRKLRPFLVPPGKDIVCEEVSLYKDFESNRIYEAVLHWRKASEPAGKGEKLIEYTDQIVLPLVPQVITPICPQSRQEQASR